MHAAKNSATIARARKNYRLARERLKAAHEALIDARPFPPGIFSKPTRAEKAAERRYDAATSSLNKRIAILRKATEGTEP